MIYKSIFREYDIRGVVPKELNEQSVKNIAYFFALEVQRRLNKDIVIAIGYDARVHSKELFSYVISGLNKANCQVLSMGMVATGVNYFSGFNTIDKYDIDATIMITGSHNPPCYNGLKMNIKNRPFFQNDIYTLRDIILDKNIQIEDNHNYIKIDVKTPYKNYMLNQFSHLKNMKQKFAIDCGNGVANTVLGDILNKLELDYISLYAKPDGLFPNHHPNPSDENNLIDLQTVLKDDIEYGFAYDGDADRVILLTQNNIVKGDIMGILFASTMINPIVVGEVKCSQVMYDVINANGGKTIMYKIGHSNSKAKLYEENATLGVEVAGHICFNDRYFGFDDGIYVTLRVLELIYNGMDIDKEIEKLPKVYSSEEISISTSEDKKFILINKIKELLKNPPKQFLKIVDIIDIDGLRIVFEDGWALVRASNTTPVLVTRFESTNEKKVKIYKENIKILIDMAKDSL